MDKDSSTGESLRNGTEIGSLRWPNGDRNFGSLCSIFLGWGFLLMEVWIVAAGTLITLFSLGCLGVSTKKWNIYVFIIHSKWENLPEIIKVNFLKGA